MATTVHERKKGVAISLSLSIAFPIKPICKCSDTSKKSLATPVSDEVATKYPSEFSTNKVRSESSKVNGCASVAMVSCFVETHESKAKCPTYIWRD